MVPTRDIRVPHVKFARTTGELGVNESELLELMRNVEAKAQRQLARLVARKQALEAAAAHELAQVCHGWATAAGYTRVPFVVMS